ELFAAPHDQPPRAQPASGEGKGATPAGDAGVPPAEFVALATAGPAQGAARDLKQAQEQLDQALHGLEHRFEPPAPRFGGKKLGELPPDGLRKRLAEMRERVGELADWIDWRHLSGRFAHLGLADFWAALQKERPPREQLPDLFLKAALSAWVEH